MREYSLPNSSNYTVELLVETDIDRLLNELRLTVVFHLQDQPDFIFNLSNF